MRERLQLRAGLLRRGAPQRHRHRLAAAWAQTAGSQTLHWQFWALGHVQNWCLTASIVAILQIHGQVGTVINRTGLASNQLLHSV